MKEKEKETKRKKLEKKQTTEILLRKEVGSAEETSSVTRKTSKEQGEAGAVAESVAVFR